MNAIRILALSLAVVAMPCSLPVAAQTPPENPQIDYAGFVDLAGELAEYRDGRRLPWAEFARQAQAEGAILLDARSESAFAAGHIEGAVNLPLPDFTAERLAEVIGPNTDRAIYIYCNNNFADDRPPVPMKKAQLALNIQTFINLIGYGYGNVWELADVIRTDDAGVEWASL
ncbi:MAG TPA: rhodanese-like domain-containing protein [Croceibacterium sp.]|nr:rhodanese-like domain-containing protein [Croceibacterium sp.]